MEYRRKYNRERRADPVEKAKEKARYAAEFAKDPERFRSYKKKSRLRELGWSEERLESSKAEQEGRCAICQVVPEVTGPTGGKIGLVPDHEHSVPPKPRGLLCSVCNAGLGMFRDNSEVLLKAAEYLRKWSIV